MRLYKALAIFFLPLLVPYQSSFSDDAEEAISFETVLSIATQMRLESETPKSFSQDQNGRFHPFILQHALDGSVPFSDRAKETNILHFWASWCKVCVAEMPSIKAFADRGIPSKTQFFAIHVDLTADTDLQRLKTTVGANIPLYVDPDGSLSDTFEVNQIPTTIIIGKNRRLIKRIEGVADWTKLSRQTGEDK